MMDYLLALLEEAEEELVEMAKLSLSLPQEDDGTPMRRPEKVWASGAEARELLVERLLPEDALLTGKQELQEGAKDRKRSGTATEEMLDKRLQKVCALTPPRQYEPSKAILEEVAQGNSLPGAVLLQRMQQNSRLAEVGGGVRFAPSAPRLGQEERTGKPSCREFLAFDRAIERDARCYDNGFSLL